MASDGLATLQADFAAWLRAAPGDPPPARLLAQLDTAQADPMVALRVYRNASRTAQRQALAAAFPITAALLGEELFAALCADYLGCTGSRSGDLHRLGAGFAEVIRAEPACHALGYVAEMAVLEWAMHRSFFAADRDPAVCVDPAAIASEDLPRLALVFPPSLVLLQFDSPVGRIWRAHQAGSGEVLGEIDPAAGPEHLALHRQPAGLCLDSLPPEEYRLLKACRAQASLAAGLDAAASSLAHLPPFNVLLPRWLELGLVTGLTLR